MDNREIELVQSMLDVTRKVLEDKQKDRELSRKKSFYQMLITITIIICFGFLWFVEIKESYNYDGITIENKSTATIERKESVK